jgi:hypothetical protein
VISGVPGLETVASHHPPEKIAPWPQVRIVHGQQIFGRPARHSSSDEGFASMLYLRNLSTRSIHFGIEEFELFRGEFEGKLC